MLVLKKGFYMSEEAFCGQRSELDGHVLSAEPCLAGGKSMAKAGAGVGAAKDWSGNCGIAASGDLSSICARLAIGSMENSGSCKPQGGKTCQ